MSLPKPRVSARELDQIDPGLSESRSMVRKRARALQRAIQSCDVKEIAATAQRYGESLESLAGEMLDVKYGRSNEAIPSSTVDKLEKEIRDYDRFFLSLLNEADRCECNRPRSFYRD